MLAKARQFRQIVFPPRNGSYCSALPNITAPIVCSKARFIMLVHNLWTSLWNTPPLPGVGPAAKMYLLMVWYNSRAA